MYACVALFVVAYVGGCDASVRDTQWRIVTSPPELAARAVAARASVRQGERPPCDVHLAGRPQRATIRATVNPIRKSPITMTPAAHGCEASPPLRRSLSACRAAALPGTVGSAS